MSWIAPFARNVRVFSPIDGGRSAAADDPYLWNPLRAPDANGMCDMTAGKRRKEGT